MSLQDLTPEKMLEHTRRWLDPSAPAGALLVTNPTVEVALRELAAVEPLLGEAPRSGEALTGAGARDAALEALTRQLARHDQRFDAKVRGVTLTLKGLQALAETDGDREALARLQQALLPEGSALTRASYRDEAGAGLRLAQRLDASARALLARVTLPWADETLETACDAIIEEAQALGRLDAEREALRAAPEEGGAQAPNLTQTKRRWVKAAKLLRQLVSLSAPTPHAQAVIFGPLDADAAAATTRGT